MHLGYLSYDPIQSKCFIPNLEIRKEMEGAIRKTNWHEVVDAIQSSEALLQAAINGHEDVVATGVEMVHMRLVNIQKYNSEESLSHVITMAFYTTIKDYIIQREMPAGKGFADLIFIPRKNVDRPALVIELKYDKSVVTAIDQIRERKYPEALRGFTNNILLVGINYDPATKQHSCRIKKADSYHIAVSQLYSLLLMLNRAYADCYNLPFNAPKNTHAYKFKQLLERDGSHPKSVEQYADEMKISRITLNNAVKAQFGVPANHLIKQRLITSLKNDILFSNKSISQLAIDYGFSHPSHLMRFFKGQTGQTITEFRTQFNNITISGK